MARRKVAQGSSMSVKEAGRKGGEKVRRWIEEGKRQERRRQKGGG